MDFSFSQPVKIKEFLSFITIFVKSLLFLLILFYTTVFQFAPAQDIVPKLPFAGEYQHPQENINFIKLDLELYSRIISGYPFQVGLTSPVDKGSISLISKYNNIDIVVALMLEERDDSTLHNLKFDNSYFKVNGLFEGLLDIRFFDIAYGAGDNYSIRPDLDANGIELSLNPIPGLKIALGYGISKEEFELYPISNSTVQTYLDGERATISPNYHALKFDVLYENDYMPIGFYYGISFIDNKNGYFAKSYLPFHVRDTILHTSFGVELDLLARFRKNAMRFDMAFTLPVGSLSRYIYIGENGDYENDQELNFLMQLYGDTEIGLGIGLSYKFLFALDTHTKQKVLGNRYDEYYKEAFKLVFTPRYTYGPLSTDAGLSFGIVGGMTARSSVENNRSIIFNKSQVYNNIVLETGINYTPFPFSDLGKYFRVRGYYKFDLGDVRTGGDNLHEVGLQLKLSFNTISLD